MLDYDKKSCFLINSHTFDHEYYKKYYTGPYLINKTNKHGIYVRYSFSSVEHYFSWVQASHVYNCFKHDYLMDKSSKDNYDNNTKSILILALHLDFDIDEIKWLLSEGFSLNNIKGYEKQKIYINNLLKSI